MHTAQFQLVAAMNAKQNRWTVNVTEVSGDRELLMAVLASEGFDLDGDQLTSVHFEALDSARDVRENADTLRRAINEISELNPELDMTFSLGSVQEDGDDGVKRIHEAVGVTCAGAVTVQGQGVVVRTSGQTEEELLEIGRKAKLERARKLLSVMRNEPNVGKAMRLLAGEPSYNDLNKAYEIVRKDLGNRLLFKIAPKDQWKRFTGTLNHPDVSGDDARHAHSNDLPPKNPMNKREVYAFAKEMIDLWINIKASTE
jgi:hypothetical protein